jgi:hypothetical protein
MPAILTQKAASKTSKPRRLTPRGAPPRSRATASSRRRPVAAASRRLPIDRVKAHNGSTHTNGKPATRRPASSSPTIPSSKTQAAPPSPERTMTQAEAFAEVVRRANEGSEKHLKGLREILDKSPHIWKTAGDISVMAQRAWIELLASGDKLVEEATVRQVKAMKVELTGPDSTPLEKLVIDHVTVAWLALQHGEANAAEMGGTIGLGLFRLRRAESAAKRFNSAVRTLTLLRTLLPKPTATTEAKPG